MLAEVIFHKKAIPCIKRSVISNIVSLIASIIAVIFVSCSYFSKKKNFLLLQSFCILFLIISYSFNGKFFRAVGLIIGLIRALIFYGYEKRGLVAPITVSVVISLLTFLSYYVINFQAFNGKNPTDLIYLTALIMYSFIFLIK